MCCAPSAPAPLPPSSFASLSRSLRASRASFRVSRVLRAFFFAELCAPRVFSFECALCPSISLPSASAPPCRCRPFHRRPPWFTSPPSCVLSSFTRDAPRFTPCELAFSLSVSLFFHRRSSVFLRMPHPACGHSTPRAVELTSFPPSRAHAASISLRPVPLPSLAPSLPPALPLPPSLPPSPSLPHRLHRPTTPRSTMATSARWATWPCCR